MSRSGPPLSPEARALLAYEREIVPQPAALRERAMARARFSLSPPAAATPLVVRTSPWSRRAIAAGFLCVASAAMGAAAHEIRMHWTPAPLAAASTDVKPAAPTLRRVVPPAEARAVEAVPPASDVAALNHVPAGQRPSKATVASDEMRLLRQARAAVASRDFVDALVPIGEHARRFKDGRLAEEREALRVKALAGLGRTEGARRAATLFEGRFPRSVLLPTVKRMPTSDQ